MMRPRSIWESFLTQALSTAEGLSFQNVWKRMRINKWWVKHLLIWRTCSRWRKNTSSFLVSSTVNEIAGFNSKFVRAVDVFDITRGIWREFSAPDGFGNLVSSSVVPIPDDGFVIIGGKNEVRNSLLSRSMEWLKMKFWSSMWNTWKLCLQTGDCLKGYTASVHAW